MPRPIRIGLCQLTSAATIEEGFTKVDNAIASIAEQGGNLAIFPEYFVQGIVADAPHKIFDEGDWEQHVSGLARKYGMDICIGTFVEKVVDRDEGEGENVEEGGENGKGGEKTYNTYVCACVRALSWEWCGGLAATWLAGDGGYVPAGLTHGRAYYFNKTGEAVGKYRKRNLWHPYVCPLHVTILHRSTANHLISGPQREGTSATSRGKSSTDHNIGLPPSRPRRPSRLRQLLLQDGDASMLGYVFPSSTSVVLLLLHHHSHYLLLLAPPTQSRRILNNTRRFPTAATDHLTNNVSLQYRSRLAGSLPCTLRARRRTHRDTQLLGG